jgi:two-component system, OmpR family, phosphate regulon sensor histidine kinase PhoR
LAGLKNIRLTALITLSTSFIFVFYIIALYLFTHSFTYVIVASITYLVILSAAFLTVRKMLSEKLELVEKLTRKLNPAIQSNNNESYEDKIEEISLIIDELKYISVNVPACRESNAAVENLINIYQRLTDEINLAKIYKVNRNEFLGNVAHELRTPVFAIQLSIETLADGAVHDEMVSMDFLGRALKHTVRLKELVDDLINISNLETGMKLSRRYFPLNSLIRETMHEMSDIVSKRKINVVLNFLIDDETRVFADPEKIKQVLINLIDNSAKYTPADGSITITAEKEDKEICITISDTGIGIPNEDLPRIFERFYRVDKTRSRDMGGSGLGLSIVKHILELHNSRISVESETGKGSKFVFYLPY